MKLSKYNCEVAYEDKVIVSNCASGGALSLNEKYARQLFSMKTSGNIVCPELAEELVKGGMLVEDDCDEYETLLLKSRIARFSNSFLALTIAPTTACNFACPYCYEKGQAYATMSDDVEERLCSFVKQEFPTIGHLSVSWYGGEPLLGIERIETLTAKLKQAIPTECAYSASIVTNGFLMTPEVVSRLAACEVKSAQITIDGSRANHDMRRVLHGGKPTYDAIVRNICDCADEIGITIRVNVDRTNIGDVSELLEELEKNDLNRKSQSILLWWTTLTKHAQTIFTA